ncbi:MAG: 50S ribosomal protein L24 [Chloroflexi bacterium]|nr:MAG: 50S ribosomal protein L24 [Chloroflexota bacterium]
MAARIRRDDTVEVNTGKDRGKRAQVRQVLPREDRVVLHGLNIVKKHRRQQSPTEPSGIIEVEAPLHLSNVAVVCPSCTKAVRVGFKRLEDGRKVRVCRGCGEAID